MFDKQPSRLQSRAFRREPESTRNSDPHRSPLARPVQSRPLRQGGGPHPTALEMQWTTILLGDPGDARRGLGSRDCDCPGEDPVQQHPLEVWGQRLVADKKLMELVFASSSETSVRSPQVVDYKNLSRPQDDRRSALATSIPWDRR